MALFCIYSHIDHVTCTFFAANTRAMTFQKHLGQSGSSKVEIGYRSDGVGKDQALILWDVQLQTDKMVGAN